AEISREIVQSRGSGRLLIIFCWTRKSLSHLRSLSRLLLLHLGADNQPLQTIHEIFQRVLTVLARLTRKGSLELDPSDIIGSASILRKLPLNVFQNIIQINLHIFEDHRRGSFSLGAKGIENMTRADLRMLVFIRQGNRI